MTVTIPINVIIYIVIEVAMLIYFVFAEDTDNRREWGAIFWFFASLLFTTIWGGVFWW